MQVSRRQFLGLLPSAALLSSCGGGGSASANPATGPGSGGPSLASIDVAKGLKDWGTQYVPYSALNKPAKLVPFNDPDFGTRMIRITDAATDWQSGWAVPAYPTTQAWNCDESLLVLYVSGALNSGGVSGGYALLDGKTYKFIQFIAIRAADVEQFYWSTTDPAAMFFVDGTKLVKASIVPTARSGGSITAVSFSTTLVHDFAADFRSGGALYSAVGGATVTAVSGGGDPFAMSLDNDLIGLGAVVGSNYVAFSYRLSNGAIGNGMQTSATVPQATVKRARG